MGEVRYKCPHIAEALRLWEEKGWAKAVLEQVVGTELADVVGEGMPDYEVADLNWVVEVTRSVESGAAKARARKHNNEHSNRNEAEPGYTLYARSHAACERRINEFVKVVDAALAEALVRDPTYRFQSADPRLVDAVNTEAVLAKQFATRRVAEIEALLQANIPDLKDIRRNPHYPLLKRLEDTRHQWCQATDETVRAYCCQPPFLPIMWLLPDGNVPPGRTRYHEGSSNTGVYLMGAQGGREALRDKLFQAANRKIEKNQWGNYDAKYSVECERHLVVVDESTASAKSMGDYFVEERTRTHSEGSEPPARPSFLLDGLHLPRFPLTLWFLALAPVWGSPIRRAVPAIIIRSERDQIGVYYMTLPGPAVELIPGWDPCPDPGCTEGRVQQ